MRVWRPACIVSEKPIHVSSIGFGPVVVAQATQRRSRRPLDYASWRIGVGGAWDVAVSCWC